jgi:hypothetical protein
MALTNNVALTRETKAFVVKETTFGVLAFPAATNVIAPLAVPRVSQEDQFADSTEIVESRSKPDRAWVGVGPGQWGLSLYARPSGAAGTAPVEDVLWECALGKKTVNAGASVVYEPAIILPSFSLCFREGHTWNFVLGCKVAEAKLSLARKNFVALDFSGSFQKVLRAGTSETASGSTTTVIKLAAGGAKLFDVGSRVQVGGANNTAQGYAVTAYDEAAETITITPALAEAPAAGVAVTGYLPTGSLAGYKIEGVSGAVSLAGAELTVTGFEGALTNALAADEEEIEEAGFVTAIDEGVRAVGGAINARYRREYAAWFRRARSQTQGAVVVTGGTAAGKKIKLELSQAVMNTPATDGDEMRRNISVALVGLPTGSLEDEYKVTYE